MALVFQSMRDRDRHFLLLGPEFEVLRLRQQAVGRENRVDAIEERTIQVCSEGNHCGKLPTTNPQTPGKLQSPNRKWMPSTHLRFGV
jgi:hypothetical protein